MKTETNFLFTLLTPLNLTSAELISLANKQLIQTISYRLMAGPVMNCTSCSNPFGHTSQYSRRPRHLSEKHMDRRKSCLGFTPFQTSVCSQNFNHLLRYLRRGARTNCREDGG